jgi:hypothetical protein
VGAVATNHQLTRPPVDVIKREAATSPRRNPSRNSVTMIA